MTLRGAEILIRMLAAYKVDTVFGVPGDTNVALYSALQEAQGTIRHIMARDERSAGFMADAYARLSRRPAVVEVPSGAGALYAVPPIAEAHHSSIPILLITSDTPIAREGQGVITELNCADLYAPITKWSYLVKSAGKIPEVVRRAFRIMTSGRPGSVHLVIPEDVLEEKVETGSVSLEADLDCCTFPARRPTAPRQQLLQLLDLIRAASRPLMIVGGGVNVSGAGGRVTDLAERLNMPVVTTITGQSAIADLHPLSIGVVGDNGFHPHAMMALEQADLLIYVGSKIGSVVTVGWTFPSALGDRKIVQIDIDTSVLGNNTRNALSLGGDIAAIFDDLIGLLPADLRGSADWLAHLNGLRADFWQQVHDERRSEAVLLKPKDVIQALGDRLVGPATILADAGTPTPNLTRYLRLRDNQSRLIIPRAFGGLGYALPAVVGAWLSRPDIRPIGLFGDGSFSMSCGELETLVRLQVPALLLHFNNACFGWIKALQRLHGHNATYSVDFSRGNASRIAEAFGLKSWRVATGSELEDALDAGLACKEPALIDIIVESIADVAPPVFSWLKRAGVQPLDLPAQAAIRLG